MNHDAGPQNLELNTGIERLCAGNWLIREIRPGMEIPVGGKVNYVREGQPLTVVADIDSIRTLLAKVSDRYQAYQLEQLQDWLEKMKAEIDPKLFAACHAFTVLVSDQFTASRSERESIYSKSREPVTLSLILQHCAAECAEVAILGQTMLQQGGFQSIYFGGGTLSSRSAEWAQDHSFVVIRIK